MKNTYIFLNTIIIYNYPAKLERNRNIHRLIFP